VIGGAIGAAVWAGVTYFFEYEIGWIAWGVGLLVGYAVAMGNRDRIRSPTAAGVVAVVITGLSIVAGKYAAVELLMPSDAEIVEMFTASFDDEEYVMSYVADEVVADYEAEGRVVEWPGGSAPGTAASQADYPADVWAEAATRWGALTDQQKAEFRAERESATRQNVEENMPEIRAMMGQGGFVGSFGPMDLIFFGLGMVTAFGVASGNKSKEAIAAEYQGAMMLGMLRVMLADGRVDDDEVGTIREVFRDATGADVPEDLVRAEADRMAEGSPDLLSTLEELTPYLDTEQRETVVRSAVEVALADGSIGPSEERLIGEIAEAVDVSESHLRGILSRLAATAG
jgi:uncharacterized tellurite resistance protein B-like protein